MHCLNKNKEKTHRQNSSEVASSWRAFSGIGRRTIEASMTSCKIYCSSRASTSVDRWVIGHWWNKQIVRHYSCWRNLYIGVASQNEVNHFSFFFFKMKALDPHKTRKTPHWPESCVGVNTSGAKNHQMMMQPLEITMSSQINNTWSHHGVRSSQGIVAW